MYDPHLDTFLIVANTGSFSHAADYLYITPSAVIQQINALEAKLKVQLFYRSNKGVSLTKQGAYLKSECMDYIKKGKAIQEQLRSMPDGELSLVLGTSLREKCRVFYDFWVQFSQGREQYSVQMKTIDTRFPIPFEVDFVESISTNASWHSSWEYYELCHVPYGLAMAKDHPLYEKPILSHEDLRDFTVILQRPEESWENLDRVKEDLEKNSVPIQERRGFDSDVVWDASIKRHLIVMPLCLRDVIFDMRIAPMDWEHSVSYGLFYHSETAGLPKLFLDFVRNYQRIHPEITKRLTEAEV